VLAAWDLLKELGGAVEHVEVYRRSVDLLVTAHLSREAGLCVCRSRSSVRAWRAQELAV